MSDGDTLYRGYWWVPGQEGEKEPGVLRIESSGRAVLELINGISRKIWEPSPDNPDVAVSSEHTDFWPMLYGQTSSNIFTLLSVSFLRSSGPVFSDNPANEDLRVWRVIKDLWLESPDEPAFVGVQVDFDHLLEWSALSAYEIQLKWDMKDDETIIPNTMKATATSRIPESLEAEWSGYRFKLRVFHNAFSSKMEGPNRRLIVGRERAALDIEFDTPQPLEVYDELITMFQNLLTLACNHPCAIRTVHFKLPKVEGQHDRGYESFRPFVYGPDSKPFKERMSSQYFFLLTDEITFAEVVPAWFDLATTAKTAIPLIFSSHYLSRGYIGPQLMAVCSGLESLHRELFNRPNESPEDFAALMELVLKDVPQDRHESIKSRLGNVPSYHSRVQDLLDQADPRAVDFLVTDRSTWIKEVKRGRNALAHGEGAQTPDMQSVLLVVSRTLGQLILGQRLGISPDRQWNFMQFNQDVVGVALAFKSLLGLPKVAREEPTVSMRGKAATE